MSVDATKLRSLPLTYRRAEVSSIFRFLRAGESCSIVGVSGMAKSNLFRHLLNSEVRKHYLGDDWQSYLFVAVDSNGLVEISECAAYELLFQRLIAELRKTGPAGEIAAKLEALYTQTVCSTEPLVWHKRFAQAASAVLNADHQFYLVILLDQFDEMCKHLNPKFFANLRSIRDENKYRISYVTFTRDKLPDLREAPEFEEFYELFSPNVIGLGPYTHEESLLLLDRVCGRYGESLSRDVCERIIELAGGHPGLLKAAGLAMLHGKTDLPDDTEQALDALLEIEDVKTECSKLWKSIDSDEREALRRIAKRSHAPFRSPDTLGKLRLRKLIVEQKSGFSLLSPILSRYASQQKEGRPSDITVRAGPISIDLAGEVWVDGRQVAPPLSKKEFMLLKYLCMNPGRLITKDEVIAVVYPDEYKTGSLISDEALNRLVQRMKEKIREFSIEREYITTVRGKGYRLDVN